MNKNAADVIAQGVKPVGRFSLSVIANALRHEIVRQTVGAHRPAYYKAADLRAMAHSLDARHDHTDPCEPSDSSCPCRQAEHDWWREAGHGVDCRRPR